MIAAHSTVSVMKSHIVAIGNSQGVRIPNSLLKQTGLSGEVELFAAGQTIVIRAAKPPRAGWARAFQRMAQCGDDALLDAPSPNDSCWDQVEWEWL